MPRTKSKAKTITPRILNCIPSANTEQDWDFNTALAAGIARSGTIPNEVDLRDDSWWSVADQGSTGSCVGWAAFDSVIRWHLVNKGRLPTDVLLSARYGWMAAKETDQFNSRPTTFIEVAGTSLKAALDVARKFGCVTDSVLPFAPPHLYQGSPREFYALASQLRVESYTNLGRNTQSWKEWLANNGPILTRLDVDQTWYEAADNNGNLDHYYPPIQPAGHAIALVGYLGDRFIVRNSWGTSWGDQGFAYASTEYARDAFTEAYGVSVAG